MQYSLRDLLLVFVLLASAMGAFGTWGIAVAGILLIIIICVRCAKNLAWAFLFIFLLLGTVALFLPLRCRAGPEAYRANCANNLKQIGLAIYNYHDAHQHMPPAFSVDSEGKPMHSWRTLILPHMEYDAIFNQYDLKEPWDGTNNKPVASTKIDELLCPYSTEDSRKPIAGYVAVTGDRTLWPGKEHCNLNEIPDGSDKTILAIELHHSNIAWAEPRDLTFEQVCRAIDTDPDLKMFECHEFDRGFFFLPEKGANVLFADSSVRGLSIRFLKKHLPAMLTRDGGEKVDFDDVPAPRLNWPRIVGLAVLAVSVICLLRRPKRVSAVSQQNTG